jgi:hypothetical protein
MKTLDHAKSGNRQAEPSLDQRPHRFARLLRRWAATLVPLALLLGTGCSTAPHTVDRGAPATIVVIPAGPPEYLNYITPITKKEALEKGLHDGLLAAVGDARWVIFLPLTMGIGAAQGLRGKTPESIDQAERILTNMAATFHFHQRLCETLVELGPSMTGHRWVLRQAPPTGFNNRSAPSGGDDGSLVLMVELPFLGLDRLTESEDPAINPTLRFRVQVRCRAVNLATGERDEIFRFGGGLHKFLTWAENDGARVRVQANRGTRILAERIINKLFAYKLEPTGSGPEDTGPLVAKDR